MSYSVPFIVGPTAVGKTMLSVMLSKKLPIEVVSADSRQIYRYLDIGTAKVPVEIRKQIPHHMIDICDPDEYFSAGMYSRIARKVIDEIHQRGRIPLVVGGSGFYISALIDGIFDLEVHDEKVRQELKTAAENNGLEALYKELQQCDPEYAAKISVSDSQRILRSLEVYRVTGRNISSWHKQDAEPAKFKPLIFGITMERDDLYRRIERRVRKMFEEGLMDEAQKLIHMGYRPDMNALNTVGYKEIFEYLAGDITPEQMVYLIQRNSRRYAKRQLTWFRKDERIMWYLKQDDEDFRTIVKTIVNQVK